MVKTIFSNLGCFKEYDIVLAEIYGHENAIYNLEYLYDSLETLENILINGELHDQSTQNINFFDRECLNKLESLIYGVANDITNGLFDLKLLNLNGVNFFHILSEFIQNISKAHKSQQTEKSEQLAAVGTHLLNEIKDKLSHAVVLREQSNFGTQVQTVVKKAIKLRHFRILNAFLPLIFQMEITESFKFFQALLSLNS
jgi:hypothetical protein